MRSTFPRPFAFALLVVLSLAHTVWSDPPIPASILDPKNPAEAWNVIRLATRNVDRLLDENRLMEIPMQISFCSPALRALPRMVSTPEAINQTDAQIKQAFTSVNAVASASQQNNPDGAKSALASLRAILKNVAQHFDPKIVTADVFFCPVHTDFVSENAKTPCASCGKNLVPRRIPYSFIYTKPGEPSVRLTATTSAPIEAGKDIEVKVRMRKADTSPVLHADLLEMHTQPIHLLIEEAGLSDYHYEHPVPTKTPGEYAFSFTPAKTAPYRIWADIVPAATGVQELPFVDLPSAGQAGTVEDTANRFTSSAGGFKFALAFTNRSHLPTKAGQTRPMVITITAPDGKPVTSLEPVMNAFAHLVGFYDDHQTVVRLHPTGGDVLNPALRGGPSLGFILYAPKAGFLRLYCQVSIGGKMLFAPFNLNVEP